MSAARATPPLKYVKNLSISIDVVGDVSINIPEYKPYMTNPELNTNQTIFLPLIPLDRKDLSNSDKFVKGAKLDNLDLMTFFISPNDLINVINNISPKKLKSELKMSSAEIQKQNIALILSIFFPKGGIIYINDRAYTIRSTKRETTLSDPKDISIKIKLNVVKGGKLDASETFSLDCKDKRNLIIEDFYKLIKRHRPKEKRTPQPSRAPLLYSSERQGRFLPRQSRLASSLPLHSHALPLPRQYPASSQLQSRTHGESFPSLSRSLSLETSSGPRLQRSSDISSYRPSLSRRSMMIGGRKTRKQPKKRHYSKKKGKRTLRRKSFTPLKI